MLRMAIFAGALTVGGATALAAAESGDQGRDLDGPVQPEMFAHGCPNGPIVWLPGTLQIDEQSGASAPAGPVQRLNRDASALDCALV